MRTEQLSEPRPESVTEDVRRALAEDIGAGDLTAALLPAGKTARARLISREPAVLCGSAWLDEVFRQLDPSVTVDWRVADGDELACNQLLCVLEGPVRSIVSGERTALNFLQTLSGTATAARRFAAAVAGTRTRILDTRKTLPGLRLAQKYATHCGGCVNHRLGLYDAVLIKENHILACGGVAAAVMEARRLHPGAPVEVEVENLDELQQALHAAPDQILLDNFSLDQLEQAVALAGGRIPLEASGNVELNRLTALAATGVDFISTGAITKHVHAIDLSLRLEDA
ncbi:carboxylating nicotinate-nucleotide diphosphorylase [Alkalilimnicola sp. S0819]|uniref:carboxylating nicotinate-nucleotide diphosphorylase n=1 Tax=Alkalilimnicola sp. S0819 TaxID=2613922 RepID=UPI0012616E64|nr:carboxylating nicotinate-nucleotide diphosphorylase [Alkalilimnicola sp. S0819]KAB7623160.1 carboxylating nicotinate-nucleotide diphosphorylase [Alkalilimnicola sp. S0819]MPQ17004.1 carboxylating nicotinate-nucleotide diphosphorylase [Alkalilimnicola sp. S0819]